MFVRIRNILNAVKIDIELKELQTMFHQGTLVDDEGTNRDYNSSDDEVNFSSSNPISWYQCRKKSSSLRIWDSFFAVVVLITCIWTPLAIVFKDSFYLNEESSINWVFLDSFNNSLWALAFFINLNRVDFASKIETFASKILKRSNNSNLYLIPQKTSKIP